MVSKVTMLDPMLTIRQRLLQEKRPLRADWRVWRFLWLLSIMVAVSFAGLSIWPGMEDPAVILAVTSTARHQFRLAAVRAQLGWIHCKHRMLGSASVTASPLAQASLLEFRQSGERSVVARGRAKGRRKKIDQEPEDPYEADLARRVKEAVEAGKRAAEAANERDRLAFEAWLNQTKAEEAAQLAADLAAGITRTTTTPTVPPGEEALPKLTAEEAGMLIIDQTMEEIKMDNMETDWIDLYGWHVGDEGAQVLAKFLPKVRGLTELYLDETNIGNGPGAIKLIEALPKIQDLETLNLNRNGLGDIGAAALARVFPDCHKLSSLNICRNNISDETAGALADSFANAKGEEQIAGLGSMTGNYSLRDPINIYMRLNNITDDGAMDMAAKLQGDQGVGFLHLEGNPIGEDGQQALVNALPGCENITDLVIFRNVPLLFRTKLVDYRPFSSSYWPTTTSAVNTALPGKWEDDPLWRPPAEDDEEYLMRLERELDKPTPES